MEKFKTSELIYNARLVSKSHINVALLHQVISQAMRDNAGSIGYLIGEDSTDLLIGGEEE